MTHTARTGQWHQHTDRITHVNESYCSWISYVKYERVIVYITYCLDLQRHQHTSITHVDEQCRSWIICVTYKWIVAHVTYSLNLHRHYHIDHTTHVNKTYRLFKSHSTYGKVMSHVTYSSDLQRYQQTHRITHWNESFCVFMSHTFEWVILCVYELCHNVTCEWVMTHITHSSNLQQHPRMGCMLTMDRWGRDIIWMLHAPSSTPAGMRVCV